MTPNAAPLTPNGLFITGTDTGVGKTLVACALLHAFAALGKRVIGMKPVAAAAQPEYAVDFAEVVRVFGELGLQLERTGFMDGYDGDEAEHEEPGDRPHAAWLGGQQRNVAG